MMWRRILICCLALALLVTTGCWSRTELNDQAIVLAMGIDKAGEHYRVSVQVIEPEQVASQKAMSGRAPATTYESVGVTLREAVRRLTRDIPRRPLLSHLRVLVIGEALAREGISGALDFLSRSNQMRTDFFVLIAKDVTALSILSISTELEKIPANTMYDAVEDSSVEWGVTKKVTLDKLINKLTSQGIHPVVPGIELIGTVAEGKTRENVDVIKSPTYLLLTGLAVFKNDRLVGWLDEEDSKGLNYIEGDIVHTAGHTSCKNGGFVTTETEQTKTKVTGSLRNGKPHIDVLLKGDIFIVEVACKIDLSDPETINELENTMNARLERRLMRVINNAKQQYRSDIFGFGYYFKRKQSKAWRKFAHSWDDKFSELSVNIVSDMQIRTTDTLNNSFIEYLDFELPEKVK